MIVRAVPLPEASPTELESPLPLPSRPLASFAPSGAPVSSPLAPTALLDGTSPSPLGTPSSSSLPGLTPPAQPPADSTEGGAGGTAWADPLQDATLLRTYFALRPVSRRVGRIAAQAWPRFAFSGSAPDLTALGLRHPAAHTLALSGRVELPADLFCSIQPHTHGPAEAPLPSWSPVARSPSPVVLAQSPPQSPPLSSPPLLAISPVEPPRTLVAFVPIPRHPPPTPLPPLPPSPQSSPQPSPLPSPLPSPPLLPPPSPVPARPFQQLRRLFLCSLECSVPLCIEHAALQTLALRGVALCGPSMHLLCPALERLSVVDCCADEGALLTCAGALAEHCPRLAFLEVPRVPPTFASVARSRGWRRGGSKGVGEGHSAETGNPGHRAMRTRFPSNNYCFAGAAPHPLGFGYPATRRCATCIRPSAPMTPCRPRSPPTAAARAALPVAVPRAPALPAPLPLVEWWDPLRGYFQTQ